MKTDEIRQKYLDFFVSKGARLAISALFRVWFIWSNLLLGVIRLAMSTRFQDWPVFRFLILVGYWPATSALFQVW